MKISVFAFRLRENAKYVLHSIKKKYMHKDTGGLTNEESSPE